MARKKVNLKYIPNDATRRATFKKRKRGLIKKASEISILCNVKTCVLIYGPHDPKPEVWPSQNGALEILSEFRNLPEQDQCKKMVNQEGFLRQNFQKAQDQLHKVLKENRDLEEKLLMHDLLSGKRLLCDISLEEASGLRRLIEVRTREVQHRMDSLLSGPLQSSNGIRGNELALREVQHLRPYDEMMIIHGGPSHGELAIMRGGPSQDELAIVRGGHDEMAIMQGEVHEELPMEAPEDKDWFNTSSTESVGCTEEMIKTTSYWTDIFLAKEPFVFLSSNS